MTMIKKMAIESTEKKLICVFSIACLVFLGLYLYFVNMIVFSVADRQRTEAKISVLEGELAKIEGDYVKLSAAKINLDYAKTLGFQDASQATTYAVTKAKSFTFSSENNEI